MRRLQVNIPSRTPHLADDHLFADWDGIVAKFKAAANALK
jgi:hypothetical protein